MILFDSRQAPKVLSPVQRIVLATLLLLRLSNAQQYSNLGSYPICYVCGSADQRVTNTEIAVQIPPGIIDIDEISCGTIAVIGLFGQLPPFICVALQSFEFFKMSCGCVDKTASSDAVEPDSSSPPFTTSPTAPSLAESSFPTGISTPSPSKVSFQPVSSQIPSRVDEPSTPSSLNTAYPTLEFERPVHMEVTVQINRRPTSAPTTQKPSTLKPTLASDVDTTVSFFPPRQPSSPTIDLGTMVPPPRAQPTSETLAPTTEPPVEIMIIQPLPNPSNEPTITFSSAPSNELTGNPSFSPTKRPTQVPSMMPSSNPTIRPTWITTGLPSRTPSISPSKRPSGKSSQRPSNSSSMQPSDRPSQRPSNLPSLKATEFPSYSPSLQVTEMHSMSSSQAPSFDQSIYLRREPTFNPTMNTADLTEDSVTETVSCSVIFSFVLRFCSPEANEVTSLFHDICDTVRYTCGVQEEQSIASSNAPTQAPLPQNCGLVGRASVNFCHPLEDEDILSILRAYCYWITKTCTAPVET